MADKSSEDYRLISVGVILHMGWEEIPEEGTSPRLGVDVGSLIHGGGV